MHEEQTAGKRRARKSERITDERTGGVRPRQITAEDNQRQQWSIDKSARHAHAAPHSIEPAEFQESDIGYRHQDGAHQRKARTVAEDHRQEIKPFTAAVNIAKRAQPRPWDVLLRATRYRDRDRPQENEG